MKTLELLAVTESLVETRETVGKYRLSKHGLLPKFGSPKNPFAKPATGETEEPVVEAKAQPVVEPAEPKQPQPEVPQTCPPKTAPVAVKPARRRKWSAFGQQVAAAVRRPFAHLNQSLHRSLKRVATPRSIRRERNHVQVELSLENVKVMRNDLRDSDLAVVPLRSARSQSDSQRAASESIQVPSVSSWDRLTARLRPAAHAEAH
jgi:hypothetical protein